METKKTSDLYAGIPPVKLSDKEKVRELVKKHLADWLSEKAIEGLLVGENNAVVTRIEFVFNYQKDLFESSNITLCGRDLL
jgi:hypothetical protein